MSKLVKKLETFGRARKTIVDWQAAVPSMCIRSRSSAEQLLGLPPSRDRSLRVLKKLLQRSLKPHQRYRESILHEAVQLNQQCVLHLYYRGASAKTLRRVNQRRARQGQRPITRLGGHYKWPL